MINSEQLAQELGNLHKLLINQGFTHDQAFEIVLTLVRVGFE